MLAYKLFRRHKDGSLGPLFINRGLKLQVGETYEAEAHPTKGFDFRPFWHCCSRPVAPHLEIRPKNGETRVWAPVDVEVVKKWKRPKAQGGTWLLAQTLTLLADALRPWELANEFHLLYPRPYRLFSLTPGMVDKVFNNGQGALCCIRFMEGTKVRFNESFATQKDKDRVAQMFDTLGFEAPVFEAGKVHYPDWYTKTL